MKFIVEIHGQRVVKSSTELASIMTRQDYNAIHKLPVNGVWKGNYAALLIQYAQRTE